VEKVSKKSEVKKQKKSGGLFGFFSKYRKDPKEWNKTNAKPEAATALANTPSSNVASPKLPRATVTAPSAQSRYVKQPRAENYATLPIEKTAKKTKSSVKGQRRKIGGLLTPDVDKLPTKKDLQEVQSTVPKSGNSNGVNIPVKP